ncbi:hypothetical protein ACTU44_14720 [Thalassospira sp. SM2505]|uniref:hypothetical protein n=1 Tax=Thalassospira TaxID=168934 RepID=UPI000DED8B77|nr:hypothetical protein [Thalassospira profundimaris]
MTSSRVLESSDTELEGLPDHTDARVISLVDTWYDAVMHAGGEGIPTRSILSAERLSRWRDDISIYEYLPIKNDFLIRIDAPSFVAASGESFQGTTPREIDLKYGTCLMAALLKTLNEKRPTFHYIQLVGQYGKCRQWLRVLLPARTTDQCGDPIFQVLGARFPCEPIHDN